MNTGAADKKVIGKGPGFSLIILAAGEGLRFGKGYKQLEPVGPQGETLIDYAIRDGAAAGFRRAIIVIRDYMETAFKDSLESRPQPMESIEYVFAKRSDDGDGKISGTGVSLLAAKDVVTGPFAVVNADDYYGPGAYELLMDHLPKSTGSPVALAEQLPHIAMVGYKLKNTLSCHGGVTRGICTCDEEGRLIDLQETRNIYPAEDPGTEGQGEVRETSGIIRRLSGDTLISMNMWGMDKDFLNLLEEDLRSFSGDDSRGEFLIPEAVGRLLRKKRIAVDVLPTDEKWLGITYKEDVQDVVDALKFS